MITKYFTTFFIFIIFNSNCYSMGSKRQVNGYPINFKKLAQDNVSDESKLGELAGKIWKDIKRSGFKRTTVEPKLHLTHKNKILKFLVEGPEIWTEYERLLSKAEYEVNIATFVWFHKIQWVQMEGVNGPKRINDGVKAIGRGLIKAQENLNENQKLKVRIMVSFNPHLKILGKSMSHEVINSIRYLVENGVDGKKLDWDKFEFEVMDYNHSGKGSFHDKYLIIDGKYSLITGANVENNNNNDPRRWHDTGISLEGPVTNSILNAYNSGWTQKNNFLYRPSRRKFLVGANKGKYKYNREKLKGKRKGSYTLSHYFPKENLSKSFWAGLNIIAVPQKSKDKENNDTFSPQGIAWTKAFEYAKKWVNVESPNINDDQFLRSIIKAASRGIKVRVLTGWKFNKGSHGGIIGLLMRTGGYNEKVIKKRIKKMAKKLNLDFITVQKNLIFKWYSKKGKKPVDGNGDGASHTKLMTVDGDIVIQGSGNQDTFAWNFSNEFNLLIDNRRYTRKLERFFMEDWKRGFKVDY